MPVRVLSLCLLFWCGILWGATVPLMKTSVSTGHHPVGLIFWSVCILSLALGPVVLWRRDRVPVGRAHLVYYGLVGATGTLVPSSITYVVAAQIPAGFMALLYATSPMFSLLIALLIRTERYQPLRMLGISLGVLAMMLLVIPEVRLPGAGITPLLALGLLVPLCYAAEGNIVERLAPPDASPIVVIFAASVLCVPVTALIAGLGGFWVDLREPWGAPEFSMLASALGHAGAYVGYVALVGVAGAVFSSQISYVVTVSAITLSLAFMGETYPVTAWFAIMLMLGGLFLVQPGGLRRPGLAEG